MGDPASEDRLSRRGPKDGAQDPRVRYWILLGLTLGLGLLNKVGMLWIGLGIAVGLLAGRERRCLATRWPWLAGGLAAALFLPYLGWNAANEWAHLEFIESATQGKYAGLSAVTFLQGLVLRQNPSTLALWLSGLGWLLFARGARGFRPLGLLWLTAFAVLLVHGHSKAGYLAPAFVVLFAAGGAAWERWLAGRRVAAAALTLSVASGALLAPLAVPMLPVGAYVSYAKALGIEPGTDEGHELAELPQFFADMFGWREKAAAIATVYRSLPPEERSLAGIFTDNYGRAGAIDYWAEEYGLPQAVSNHNNYWLWGPGELSAEVVVVLGGHHSDLESLFESVELAGVARCDGCIPYENDVPIFVGRQLRVPVDELWEGLKHYD